MANSTWNFLLLVSTCTLVAFVAAQNYNPRESPGPSRQVEIFVNVHDHPKTGFTCKGKAAGQYYADPDTKCAVYYVCISNPHGALTPQSFACPNGTIFSQATRVCRPHEEVFCNLATRYYDNAQGQIDTKGVFDELPMPDTVPMRPIPAAQPAAPRRQHAQRAPKPQPAPLPQAPQQPVVAQPKPAPANSNLFNSNSNGNRFRNSRNFQSAPTASTSTPRPAPPPPPAPAQQPPAVLGDYEYDYSDYGNETAGAGGLNKAASSLHAQIIENIAQVIAKESKEQGAKEMEAAESKIIENVVSRQKRQSQPWMLSRRKGQLRMETVESEGARSATARITPASTVIAFSCEDKLNGVAYADLESQCSKFYVCMTIAKGKMVAHHLDCDDGTRFNQVLGMCSSKVTVKACSQSEHYFAYNKFHKTSKKHLLANAKKQQQLSSL